MAIDHLTIAPGADIGGPGRGVAFHPVAVGLGNAAFVPDCRHGSIGIPVRAIRMEQRSKERILAILQSLPARSTLHLNAAC